MARFMNDISKLYPAGHEDYFTIHFFTAGLFHKSSAYLPGRFYIIYR